MKRQGDQMRVGDLPVAGQPRDIEVAGGREGHIILPELVVGQSDDPLKQSMSFLKRFGLWDCLWIRRDADESALG